MEKNPLPFLEQKRVEALMRYEILDTLSEEEFDDITWLASNLCRMPIAFISLIDSDRLWIKSKHNFPTLECPRGASFCTYTIENPTILEIHDALADPRFETNPFVVNPPNVRFYAGAPLKTPSGHHIGSLGVADSKPGRLSAEQHEALERLSHQVIRLMESRLAQKNLQRLAIDERKSLIEKDRWASTLLSNLDGMAFRSSGVEKVVFEYVSAGCRGLLGVDPEVLISQKIKYFELIHPEDKARVMAHRTAIIQGRRPYEIEYRLVLPSEEIKWVWARGRPVYGVDDKFEGLEGIITDITERKQMEANFLRAERIESIGTLAGGIAHDLNNLLAPIMMGVDLLKHFGLSEQGLKVIEDIERSTKRGASLVKQVLSFARGDEGARVSVHIGDVIKEVASITKSSFPKSITLKTRIAGDLALVLSDPTLITQVLLNLCVNARDALLQGGTITIAAKNKTLNEHTSSMLQRKIPTGRYVCIEVIDDGTGIPKENLDRIFDPFFTTKELGKGTGLGLATVLGIVRGHGGFVDVKSELGKGTTFQILLPAAAPVESAHAQDEADDANTPLPKGNGEWILVIDDEPAVLSVTAKTLKQNGYQTFVAANGEEALTILKEQPNKIALAITDMMMPGMDGPTTVAAMKVLIPSLRVICCSGLQAEEQQNRAAELGVRHFLAKPYTTDVLLRTLQKVLSA